MSPLLILAIPLALTMIGIMPIGFHIVHDQPAFSYEQDAFKRTAERQANARIIHQHSFASTRCALAAVGNLTHSWRLQSVLVPGYSK